MERFVILEDYKDSSNIINTLDFGVILGNIDNPLPTIKTEYIDNPGSDGSIDNTESLDEIKYNDKTITMPFTMRERFNDIEEVKSKIANFIHGKRFKIYLYKDLDYYYVGRISMQSFAVNKATGTFSLVATCKPYKYKKGISSYTYQINESMEITIFNERKYVVPKITVFSDMIITFENIEYLLSEGIYEIPDIYLKSGKNIFLVSGTGTFTIEFQEASL